MCFFCFDVSSLVLTLCLNFEIVLMKFVSNYTLVCRNLDLQEFMLIYNIYCCCCFNYKSFSTIYNFMIDDRRVGPNSYFKNVFSA